MQKQVSVVSYNPEWAQQFIALKNLIWPLISDFAISIEHVGSTSVVGLAAKPVIDIDIIIPDMSFLDRAIQQLGKIGYEHRGDLGILDRHAFRAHQPQVKHNLYVCPQDSIALKNHLCLRDNLRSNSKLRDEYSALKQKLALEFPDSIDQYIEGKTDFILGILANNGLSSDRIEEIRKANLAPKVPTFETQRLILREVTEENAADWQKNFVDYEVVRNLSALVPWPYPDDGVISFLKNVILPNLGKERWVWGIFLKENPQELVGVVDLWRKGKPENRGFWLARKHWKKGIMTEAVAPVMDYAFNNLGFTELVFSNALGNIGSRRVKEKTGARLLRIETARFVDPALSEQEIWELKKEDWFKFKKL